MPSEIVVEFELTPKLWFRASRHILQRQHRWLSPRVAWPVTAGLLLLLAALDYGGGFGEGLLPLLVLVNGLVVLVCLALCLTPTLIRRRFESIYQRFPAQNRRAVWRFSTFGISAEGGMTRFDGTWDDVREIVATPEFFLIFRKEKSAGVVPRRAFASEEQIEDFMFMAKFHETKVSLWGTEGEHPHVS